MTTVVNLHHSVPYDVYIGRPRVGQAWGFGNPFVVGTHGAQGECLELFQKWLETGEDFGNKAATPFRRQWILDNIPTLKGKTLGCFCKPKPCHGDVLAKMADQEASADSQVRRVGCVGTAGRDPLTIPRLTLLYPKMVKTVMGLVTPDDFLQSGGAAWADHVAVSIFKIWSQQGLNPKIKLFLPCNFDFTGCYFTGTGAQAKTAWTANNYHRIFSRAMGADTLLGLAEVLRMPGCEWYPGEGFHSRNLDVGNCDLLIAQTFATGNYPADGGTEHCWRNSQAKQKIHISLTELEASDAT